jgi:hypothetical protein
MNHSAKQVYSTIQHPGVASEEGKKGRRHIDRDKAKTRDED